MSAVKRFLGDSPLRVLVKLVVLSFLAGAVMSAFAWTPLDILHWAQDAIFYVWHMGFDAIEGFLAYILLGAAVVVPVFLLVRLLSFRRG